MDPKCGAPEEAKSFYSTVRPRARSLLVRGFRGRAFVSDMEGRRTYTDPATGIRYDTSNPDYQGWLTKQSVWLKDWRRRYFILKSSKLFFCKSENSTPHGMIDLASCMTVKSAEYKAHKRNALEVRSRARARACPTAPGRPARP